MSLAELAAALAGGTIVVTPTKRLARALVARHDAVQLQRGAAAWTAAHALPWSAWLQSLWSDALVAGALTNGRALLSPAASTMLWDRIVADDSALLDTPGAASAAAEAWTAFHAWREPGESSAAWQHAGIDDDAASFSRWATRYQSALDERQRLDPAEIADALIAAAPNAPCWRNQSVVLAGFLEWSPQQARLLAALSATGMQIARIALPPPRESNCSRRVYATVAAEVAAALGHARATTLADPAARVGIVIGDLANRRDAVIAAAEDILCPELAASADANAPRPYDISLGTDLTDVPLVATALRLIEWSAGALPMSAAATLLRSPYLPGDANAWLRRARMERGWREAGMQHITLAAALVALPAGDPLVALWKPLDPGDAGRKSPEAWALAWRGWLSALGWPGPQPLASGEWQARDAWWRLLGAFATLESVVGVTTREEALTALRAIAKRTLFAPEARGARIQILGTLEAAGLEFDSLWIAGMTADRWPPPTSPHALLPLTWQRTRGVPRADPARTLAFARAVTTSLVHAAPHVIASHAQRENDAPTAISSLVADWAECEVVSTPVYGGLVAAMASARPELEMRFDAIAPLLASGAHAHGGVAVVEHQSVCPFQAFARHRLRPAAWPDVAAGLLPEERGSVLHRALAAFWQDVGTHAALVALSMADLEARIAAAVDVGLAALEARRWRQIPPAVAAAEGDRLASVMLAWLDTLERERPPFRVDECEQTHALTLGDLEFRLRIDRVDVLDNGGRLVIDYKAGRATGTGQWFAQRPTGTQLGMYALALRTDDAVQAVRAVAFGQMKAGEVKVVGLAADERAWPRLKLPSGPRSRLPVDDWHGAVAFWEQHYGALATAFRNGEAAVSPRNAQACRYCELQALCRIQRLDDSITGQPDSEAADDDDDA